MKGNKGLLILGAFVCLSAFRWDDAPAKVREGNRLFEKKEYEEALNRYRDAQASRPNAAEIPFDMGNSLYRQKDYKEAAALHRRSLELASGGALAAKAHYNIGNSLYREGDLKGALEVYKKAIDLDPNDLDTKYNIEVIQRQLKEKQTPQSKQSQSQKEQQPQQKEEEKSSGSEQNKENQEQEKQSQKEKEAEQKSPSQAPSEISKKDAERLLNALQGGEKSLSKVQQEKTRRAPEPPVEKDW